MSARFEELDRRPTPIGEISVRRRLEPTLQVDVYGALGAMSRKLGDAGVNITVAYLATDTRLVFAAEDLATARAALD